MLEGIGIVAALSRARELSQDNWWRTYGTLLVAIVVVYGAAFVALIVLAIPLLSIGAQSSPAGWITGGLWPVLVTGFAAPFLTGVIGLLYLGQREPQFRR